MKTKRLFDSINMGENVNDFKYIPFSTGMIG